VTESTTADAAVRLDDRFEHPDRPALVNGHQALVQALLAQQARDRAAGLRTAGYVTGYRGSPLGGLDLTLMQQRERLQAADIVFEPGVNEELAATAVWGTQQLAVVGDGRFDGVFALWYGKGPGVDRAGDPIKHGNYSGTHADGGVLLVYGDDHPGKSSTVAHHSQQALAANSVPSLYPADVGEFVRYALLGWALSRYSGCWVGFKVVNETAEQAMNVGAPGLAMPIVQPEAVDLLPPEGVHYRGVYAPVREEQILRRHRLPLVQRFARANRIDAQRIGDGAARFGIVTAGRQWHDVRLALQALGIDDVRARGLGVAVYKVGLIWPLEPEGLTAFAAGKSELLVVEEKTSFIEAQAAALLYVLADRPRLSGKTDGAGAPLLASDVAPDPLELAQVIAARLQACGLADEALTARAAALRGSQAALLALVTPTDARRTPYFCSGCPHGTSTQLPEGSIAFSGIGCHGMAVLSRTDTRMPTQMGGEGLSWVGLHRFTARPHAFQNLGDGTYFHSGSLAIRAAVASGANITFKILYNDAVAMTGGQPVDGPLSVSRIVQQVLAEGVQRVVLVSDDPSRHPNGSLPAGVRVEHRDALDRVQRALCETPGCTVLVYEQTCAAELRRRRKRGKAPEPPRRLFIHDEVCEGCGDCVTQSSCISLETKDTPLGTKRTINASACNQDESCLKGFCPSIVSLEGARPRRAQAAGRDAGFDASSLPEPAVAPLDAGRFGVMITGVGGSGVITIGAVLAMAVHLDGRAVSTYDMTGLAQKNGAVFSHLQVAERPEALGANRLGLGEASLLLAFDLVAALADDAWRTIDPARTFLAGNDRVLPTAAALRDPAARPDASLLQRRLAAKVAADRRRFVDATGLATALLGDAIASNFFLVGAALQWGWLPVSRASLEQALRLNGAQVAMNLQALALGRLWAHDAARVSALLPSAHEPSAPPLTLDATIALHGQRLAAYQDAAYAARWREVVDRVRERERAVAGDAGPLTQAVAVQLARLMAYKDEYEVARLYAQPSFRAQLDAQFEGVGGVRLHLAPPILSRPDPATGRARKRTFGPWLLRLMPLLAAGRRLRGGVLDPFGHTAERRTERALIGEYRALVDELLVGLDAARVSLAVEIAASADAIRGYGPVKAAAVERTRRRWGELLARWRATEPTADAVAVTRAA
jgi:indolepyruvate ferredoxin oxidoreductase